MLSTPKILVCTDFSLCSKLALKAGERLRVLSKGELEVLHVLDYPTALDWVSDAIFSPGLSRKTSEEEIKKKTERVLQEQMNSCEVHGSAIVLQGSPITEIEREIVEKKIDLVVIGHVGKSRSPFHLGNVAEKVVATSKVPVLIVKSDLKSTRIGALVPPKAPMNKIISWAEEFSYLLSTDLVVVSLFKDPFPQITQENRAEHKPDVVDFIQQHRQESMETTELLIRKELNRFVGARLIVQGNDDLRVAGKLRSILEAEGVELAVMQRHHSQLLERIIIGSETKRMLEFFPGNLLILPP